MMYDKLESNRLGYRYFKESDLDFLIALLGDDRVCKYLPEEKAYSPGLIKRILDYYIYTTMNNQYQNIYLVYSKDTSKPIGYSGIQIVKEFEKYEIFYAFLPEVWNQGYATEASLRMKSLAKNKGLKEVIALADCRNLASQKVLEKTGYQKLKDLKLWGLDLFYYEMKFDV